MLPEVRYSHLTKNMKERNEHQEGEKKKKKKEILSQRCPNIKKLVR